MTNTKMGPRDAGRDSRAQLEAVIGGIEERIDHTLECRQHAVALDMQGETPDCHCSRTARVRAELARTLERMIDAAGRCGMRYGVAGMEGPMIVNVREAAIAAGKP